MGNRSDGLAGARPNPPSERPVESVTNKPASRLSRSNHAERRPVTNPIFFQETDNLGTFLQVTFRQKDIGDAPEAKNRMPHLASQDNNGVEPILSLSGKYGAKEIAELCLVVVLLKVAMEALLFALALYVEVPLNLG